jgi:hypothetical protein
MEIVCVGVDSTLAIEKKTNTICGSNRRWRKAQLENVVTQKEDGS